MRVHTCVYERLWVCARAQLYLLPSCSVHLYWTYRTHPQPLNFLFFFLFFFLNKEPDPFSSRHSHPDWPACPSSTHPHKSQTLKNLHILLRSLPLAMTAGRAHLSQTPSTTFILFIFSKTKKETKTLRSERPYHPMWALPWREPRRIKVQEPDLRSLRPSCLACAAGVSRQAAHMSSCQGRCRRKWCDEPGPVDIC